MTNPYTPGDHITVDKPEQPREWPHGTTDRISTWAHETLGFRFPAWQLDIMRQFEAPKPRIERWKATPRVDSCGRPTGKFDIREGDYFGFLNRA